jgi:hypothetical protein
MNKVVFVALAVCISKAFAVLVALMLKNCVFPKLRGKGSAEILARNADLVRRTESESWRPCRGLGGEAKLFR